MWKKSLLVLVLAAALLAAGCSSGDNDNKADNNNDTNVENNEQNNNTGNNDENKKDNDEGNNDKGSDNEVIAPIEGDVWESTDGSVQLTFPDDWNEDLSLNRAAIIGASKYETEKYTLVMPTQKVTLSEGATLNDFYEVMSVNMQETVVNYAETNLEELTINGMNAMQYVVNGEVENVKITYLITLIESENRFYQLASWTLPSLYDQYEEEYKGIAASFNVSPEAEKAAAEQVDSEQATKKFTSTNGEITLTVPESWEEDHTVFNPAADFILSSQDMMKYLMVIRDNKSDLTDGMTLAEYQELLEEMTQTTGIENYESTNPESLKINGNDALQYEVIGSIQGVQLHYLYTIIETDDHFHQIMIWSDQATFPTQKDLFQEVSASYQFNG